MTKIIDSIIANKIEKAHYDSLVNSGTITPGMIQNQLWLFTDDQYVSASNIADWNSKQPALVSGTNIKTINNQSILGSGDLSIAAGGLDFKGYISDLNYINLKKLDLGIYYVMAGTTYSLVDNPGPNQRRTFNNYAIYLSTGYTLIINKNIDDIAVDEYFAYAYGLIDSNSGIRPQYVAFKKLIATNTYGFSFAIQDTQNSVTRPLVYTNEDQTITAKKTFSVLPESNIVPTTDDQLVNKKYVDDNIPTVPTNVSAFTNDAGYITGINSGDVTTALGYTPVNPNIIGANNGIAELDSAGKVPTSQLPSYVDDVVEYASKTNFPVTGETGKIYLALDTNLTYRWGGTEYVEISPSLALGETSDTAYRGDRGKIAYDHAISPHAPVNAEANVIDSISVNNTSITPVNKNVDITVPTKTSDLNNDSGYITGMTILSYGHSTWNEFLTAYNADKVVYCRASSNSNPGTGAQNRLAFMAYLNNATSPTEVEFQYYRSVSSHSDSQQGDQMYVYKLTSSGTWTVTVRNSFSKVIAGTNLTSTYANNAITLNAPSNVSAFNNDAGYLTSETDPVFSASPAAGITSQDITNWNNSSQTVFYVTEPCSASQPFNLSNRKKGIYIFPFDGAYYRDVYFTYDGTLSQDTYAKMLPGNNILYVKEDIPDFSDSTYIPDEYMAELSFIGLDSTTNIVTYTLGGVLYDTSAPHCYVDLADTETMTLQDKLVSGTNIKTINGNSILGSGDLVISGGGSAVIESNLSTTSSNPFIFSGKATGLYQFAADNTLDGVVYTRGRSTDTVSQWQSGAFRIYIYKEYDDAVDNEEFAIVESLSGANNNIARVTWRLKKDTTSTSGLGGNTKYYYNVMTNINRINAAQTITAKKTFTVLPESSVVPTTDDQLVNKKYVDDHSGGSSKYVGTITGDGTTTSFTITHNLNSRDVIVQVYDNTSYENVLINITRDTVNTVQIDFTTAPILDKVYKVVVM